MTHNDDYTSRINRVIDYIENNLEKDFSLEELAGIACFSKFHFHRLFQAYMKESLFQFIQRVRLEKAAASLACDKEISITDLAFTAGFGSSQAFSRSFKKRFGKSPREYRESTDFFNPESCRIESSSSVFHFNIDSNGITHWEIEDGDDIRKASVVNRVKTRAAYLRYIGPYKGDSELFQKLWGQMLQWAAPRNLINADSEFITIYHDPYQITEDEKLRISVCLSIPDNINIDGSASEITIPGGDYVVSHFQLKAGEYEDAWNWFYLKWFPVSGYLPDDRPLFEFYPMCEPDENGRISVDIYIPVKPF